MKKVIIVTVHQLLLATSIDSMRKAKKLIQQNLEKNENIK